MLTTRDQAPVQGLDLPLSGVQPLRQNKSGSTANPALHRGHRTRCTVSTYVTPASRTRRR
jgi:hypothetical protein